MEDAWAAWISPRVLAQGDAVSEFEETRAEVSSGEGLYGKQAQAIKTSATTMTICSALIQPSGTERRHSAVTSMKLGTQDLG
jgi:hypothetical protein